MLKLTDICEYIRARVEVGEGVTAGVIDEKTKRCIGVYDNNRSQSARMALGGAENTKYRKQKITVLVHWGSTQDGAMEKAHEIYGLFRGVSDVCLGRARIAFFTAYEPQCIGFTADKICEYVVPVDAYINQ